jgi:predicted N-acetyltransferase YhbS
MLDYKITPLERRKDCIEACAAWAYVEWGINRGTDFKEIIQRFTEGAQLQSLPLTLVALNKELTIPIGMVSLWKTEKGTAPELSPWLAALYVSTKFRGNGIGENLVADVEKTAALLGHEELYLQTDEALEYYPRLGYQPLSKSFDDQTIFRKKLL